MTATVHHLHASEEKPKTKPLPHSAEAERSVIGGVLIHGARALADAIEHVTAEDFYNPVHDVIWRAFAALDAAGKAIDPLTVAEQMRADGTLVKLRDYNGEAYFAGLMSSVVTVDNIAHHAAMVRGTAQVRRVVEVCDDIVLQGRGDYGDVAAFVDGAAERVARAAERPERHNAQTPRVALREVVRSIEARHEAGRAITGVPSGYGKLDAMTAGFQPGDLVIVAARPSMGKTSLVMNAVQNAAIEHGVPSLVFSLEMSRPALFERSLCCIGRIDSTRMRTGGLQGRDWSALTKAAAVLHPLPIAVDDSPALTVAEIRAKARRWRAKQEPGSPALVAVDYLGLIGTPKHDRNAQRNREQDVAEMTRGLKALAKELRVPVVVLAQLNRGVESRSDKRPMLSDLRESGAIEQDADLVLFIYRDEVYRKDSPDKGVAEVIVGKQRNGPTGTVRLAFLSQYTRFENLNYGDDGEAPRHWNEGDDD